MDTLGDMRYVITSVARTRLIIVSGTCYVSFSVLFLRLSLCAQFASAVEVLQNCHKPCNNAFAHLSNQITCFTESTSCFAARRHIYIYIPCSPILVRTSPGFLIQRPSLFESVVRKGLRSHQDIGVNIGCFLLSYDRNVVHLPGNPRVWAEDYCERIVNTSLCFS